MDTWHIKWPRGKCACVHNSCVCLYLCVCILTDLVCVCVLQALGSQQRVWILPCPPLQWPRHGLMVSLILPLKWMTSAPPTCTRVVAQCLPPCVPTPPYPFSCNGWIVDLPSYPSLAWHSLAQQYIRGQQQCSSQYTPLPLRLAAWSVRSTYSPHHSGNRAEIVMTTALHDCAPLKVLGSFKMQYILQNINSSMCNAVL